MAKQDAVVQGSKQNNAVRVRGPYNPITDFEFERVHPLVLATKIGIATPSERRLILKDRVPKEI